MSDSAGADRAKRGSREVTKQPKPRNKQRLCRICKKRTPWHYKNCPPGICKRCYHKHVWPERPAARTERDVIATEPEELVFDGYLGGYTPFGERRL